MKKDVFIMTKQEFLKDWLPILLWASVIFFFSAQPYEKQELSPQINGIIDKQLIEENFSHIKLHYASSEVSVQRLGAAKFVEFFIRKSAHFIEFAVLAFLIYRALRRRMIRTNVKIIGAFAGSVLYAISDEFHQSFTSNRTPLVHDVFIDSLGALFGVLVAFIIYKYRLKV
jgi:VanZ family protein